MVTKHSADTGHHTMNEPGSDKLTDMYNGNQKKHQVETKDITTHDYAHRGKRCNTPRPNDHLY